jgi:hypothetical protein
LGGMRLFDVVARATAVHARLLAPLGRLHLR